MTFKHSDFSSSEVMRSLERLVVQKGIVKPEQFIKQASITKSADYLPTENLTENVMKLCGGLRSQGLVKQASELEANFLAYKQAQTLYQAHKETGDDLIESAHPEGSHKLRDVDSDEATFEDILEQHVKSLQVANKTPKGKLSSAALISKVKTVLGQASWVMPTATPEAVAIGETAAEGVGGILSFLGAASGVAEAAGAGVLIGGILGRIFIGDYTLNSLEDAGKRLIADMKNVESEMSTQESIQQAKFVGTFGEIVPLLSQIDEAKQGISKSNVVVINKLNNLIYQSRQYAGNIWSYAQGHKDQQFLGSIRGFGSVVASCKNYFDIATKINGMLDTFFEEALKTIYRNNAAKKNPPPAVSLNANDPLVEKGNAMKDRANALGQVYSSDPAAVKWAPSQVKAIQSIIDKVSNIPKNQLETYRATLNEQLAALQTDNDNAEQLFKTRAQPKSNTRG